MALSYSFLSCFVSLVLLKVVAAQSGCFWANGTENPTIDDYKPCTGPGLSSCCSSIRDVCLDNGLCRANTGFIWRETCTNRDWDTGACQDLCAYNATQKATDQIVTPCDGTENSTVWCCGESDACCGQDSTIPRYTIARRFTASVSTTTSSPVSSLASSSTLTSFVMSTSSTTPITNSTPAAASSNTNSETGLSTGEKAGIGVGAAIGALGLIGLGMFIAKALQWRKKLQAKEELAAPISSPVVHGARTMYQTEGTPVHELQQPVAEKPENERYGSSKNIQELSASSDR